MKASLVCLSHSVVDLRIITTYLFNLNVLVGVVVFEITMLPMYLVLSQTPSAVLGYTPMLLVAGEGFKPSTLPMYLVSQYRTFELGAS